MESVNKDLQTISNSADIINKKRIDVGHDRNRDNLDDEVGK